MYDRGAIAVRDVAVDSLAEAAQMRLAGAFIREDIIIRNVQVFIGFETQGT